MICVSIGRGRHRHMLAEHKHLVEQGAELVELRLDYINGEPNLRRLVQDRPGPVVITCRREADGGKWSGNEETRQMLLRSAIAEGVDYVDLEEDVAKKIPRFGNTKRIVSMHDFRSTPKDLEQIHARLAACDADIVKLATMAHTPQDNVRMLRLMRGSEVPTVGMCMGDMGTPTRVLAAKFGAPFTYATFHHERALAPGQLSFAQMREIYHYDLIDNETRVFGVIADPVGHSMSPMIHNAAFRHEGENCVYVPFRIPKEHLEEFLNDCADLGIEGLSVTIPHKEAVIRHLAKIDGSVRGIGACNTVVFKDGQRLGFNTDYRAAMDSIDGAFKIDDETPGKLEGKTALVLGAGGVSRAIVFGLQRRGANVVICNRTLARAEQLAGRFGVHARPWGARHSIKPHLVVNCTPIGMHPNVDESPLEKHFIRPAMTVFDTVYNPENTLLIKQAKQQGAKTVTGVDMFVRQAALQFRHFTGKDAPSEVMREQVKRAIGAARM